MRLRHVCLYILTASLFFIFPAPLLANEVSNGSFELGSSGWITNSSGVIFEVDQMNSFEASRSAKLSYDGASFRGVEQSISGISGGDDYQVSGVIRLDSLLTSAYIRIAWYASADASGTQLSTSPSVNNDGASITTDWSVVDFIAQAPSNARSAKIRLYVQGGSVHFDAIVFERNSAPTHTPTDVMPTPTITNSPSPPATMVPTIMQTSYSNVYISEVMVAPDSGGNEWVELYNGNDFEVTLTNWYIDDVADAGSTPRLITINIAGKAYETIELTSGIFNNSGDSVRLLDSISALKHEFIYTSYEKGYTWGAKNTAFNSFCIQSPSKRMSNSECVILSDDVSISTVATGISAMPTASILGAHNSGSNSLIPQAHKYYRIVVTPPTLPTQTPTQILGAHISHSPYTSGNTKSNLPFLAGTYSLLSGISLSLKVYLKQTSNIPL